MPRKLLGRLPRDPRKPVLHFSNYLKVGRKGGTPVVPTVLDYTGPVKDWGMMMNDTVGDCTIAGLGHMVQLWSANTGHEIVVPDAQIQQAYVDVTGQEGAAYDPKTGKNDNGCVETDVLDYAMKTGVGGQKILGYVYVNPKNYRHVRLASMLFGGVYTGFNMPNTASAQVDAGKDWTVVWPTTATDSVAGSWGGHCAPVFAYDQTYLTCITWAAKQRLSWNWWYWYCDEAYAIVSQDWVNAQGHSPSGFDLASLLADLAMVKDQAAAA